MDRLISAYNVFKGLAIHSYGRAAKYLRLALGICVISGFLLLCVSWYMLDVALKPGMSGRDLAASYTYMYDTYPGLELWVDSLMDRHALRDTMIVMEDGARMSGYYIPAPKATPATAVVVHGYTDNAIRMLMIARMYHRNLGYNVLLPDLRNSGRSDGDHYQMGWKDRYDVMRWMDVANERFGGDTQMVVHGLSMGGATVMMLSGEKLPTYVKCLVEDCGYTSVWDEFEHELKQRYGLPAFPILHTASWLSGLRYGWRFDEASSLRQLSKASLPMLFIHGSDDFFVPTYMVYELYDAYPGEKEIWVPEGVRHGRSYQDHPEGYTSRVNRFTERYITRDLPGADEEEVDSLELFLAQFDEFLGPKASRP